jgi:hypothetical protein
MPLSDDWLHSLSSRIRVATSVATVPTFCSLLARPFVFKKWCARQESNLLPCGPEMANLPFGLSSVNSRNATECRQMPPLPSQIAVKWLIRALSGLVAVDFAVNSREQTFPAKADPARPIPSPLGLRAV